MDQALTAFSHDLSGGDPAMAAQIAAIIANPPTTLEEIGFYGAEDASTAERKFRAAIYRLSEAGYILGFEDKYIHEMPWLLAEKGWVDSVGGLEDLAHAIEDTYETEASDDVRLNIYRDGFGDHVAAIEHAASRAGTTLLSVDLPVGDTFHLIAVPPKVATRWRNVTFLQEGASRFAVSAPRWDIYFGFLGYAILGGLPGDSPVPAPDPASFRSLRDAGFDT